MPPKSLFNAFIGFVLFMLMSGCTALPTVSPSMTQSMIVTSPASLIYTPTDTPLVNSGLGWEWVEKPLSMKILGTAYGKCEWEVLGWMEQEVYVWTLCRGGPGKGAVAASVPAVINVNPDHSIGAIEFPGLDSDYGDGVRRLFPPAVQGRIFAHDFDVSAADEHLALRWKDPSIGPAIFLVGGEALPILGEPAIPAISAAEIERLTPILALGEGAVDSLTYLPDGRLVVYGKRGIEIVDNDKAEITRPFNDQMEGDSGALSKDGSLLAAWTETEVKIICVNDGNVLQTIVPNLPDGTVEHASILTNQNLLALRVRPAGEEIYSQQIEFYDLAKGNLNNSWEIPGLFSLISPEGNVIAGWSAQAGLNLWSVPDGKLIFHIPGWIETAAFSLDGSFLGISDAGIIKVFYVQDGKKAYQLTTAPRGVSGIAFSPDGERLLTWSGERTLARLWLISNGTQEVEFPVKGVRAGAFSPDGTQIALAGNEAIGFYSASTGQLIDSLENHFQEVRDISFSDENPYGKDTRLAVLYGTNTQINSLVNWAVPQGIRQFLSFDYSGVSLEYTRDLFGIAVGTLGGQVQMIDPINGTLLRTFQGSSYAVQDLAQNNRGKLAASSMGEVRIYSLSGSNAQSNREIRLSGGWVGDVTWGCYLVASTSDGTVKVIENTGLTIETTLHTVDDGYQPLLVINPDCSQILAAQNRAVFRWQTSGWAALPTWQFPKTVTALAVSPDGSLAVIGFEDGGVQLLEISTGNLLRFIEDHTEGITDIEFSNDGSYLGIGSVDGIVTVWGIE